MDPFVSQQEKTASGVRNDRKIMMTYPKRGGNSLLFFCRAAYQRPGMNGANSGKKYANEARMFLDKKRLFLKKGLYFITNSIIIN